MTMEHEIEVAVTQRKRESQGVISLSLKAVDGTALPSFEPGAHIDVILSNGIVRQYSLCSEPVQPTHYRIGVLLTADSRGGSREIHRLAVGDRLFIRPPRNNFRIFPETTSGVLVAGGIGVTPIMSMARHLSDRSVPFVFHYFTRSRALTPFRKEITSSTYKGNVVLRHDDVGGRPTSGELRAVLGAAAPGKHAYICGPEALLAACVEAAAEQGWPSDHLHFERFRASTDHSSGRSVTVKLARSGRTVEVPENVTLAQALIRAGVAVAVSCEQGICGTCITTVLEGVPDHRDVFLSDSEKTAGGKIALCCSRAKTSSLTLDL